jgi:hypothetical protein
MPFEPPEKPYIRVMVYPGFLCVGGGNFLQRALQKKIEKRIKNVFICIFVTFLRVAQILGGGGSKPVNPPPDTDLCRSTLIIQFVNFMHGNVDIPVSR